ncbi:Dynein heavy chain 1 like protein [Argiope bruennichi]|uniref:Dynein heavy chain 1 like protein n=1 Tax=Argiope bruennichi TaxID=94029 RepID=A0A8T0FK49_ARGBR|nr:Dynein heavy chain 1 like protein [Argiope bruennichi]
MLGWVHTPPFTKTDLTLRSKLRVPGSRETPESSTLYFKKGFDPKIQVENRVPYGKIPKRVAVDIEKRKFARQDFKKILQDLGLEISVIRPPILRHRSDFLFLKSDYEEGIPSEPFLQLELFDDDWLYEIRSPYEWLSLGSSDMEQRPVPGTALIPVEAGNITGPVHLEWQDVAVLDYDDDNKLFLVRNEEECPKDGEPSVYDTQKVSDLWVPRIYLRFKAEEPFHFARRLRSAVTTRHIVEESIRINYYVENIPIEIEKIPKWPEKDLNDIIATARRSRHLQPKLQWIKDELDESVKELQLEFKRAVNCLAYMDVSGQDPNLLANFQNERLGNLMTPHKSGHLVKLNYPFKDRLENFRSISLWNQAEVVRALNLVQQEILAASDMTIYHLTPGNIFGLDQFETEQRAQLQKVDNYLHGQWLNSIANSILATISRCKTGSYDLNQTVQHTFRLTKIGKLLKLVGFKMQDVMRSMVMESVEQYAKIFEEACANLEDIMDNFEWTESFVCSKWSPLRSPVFEVGLDIKGVHLEFLVDLQKYRDVVVDLFGEALRVTQGLPKLEKLVMKKLLYNPDDKLESVGSWEKQISRWKKNIVAGLNKAIIVTTAYAKSYDDTLEAFKEDQINYVKKLARAKVTCEQLKEIIEMHHSEKNRLQDIIPRFVDIGPFRLMTDGVRLAAVRKHEQLADAVLSHFYDKLRQKMETINDQFLVLLDRIDQPTGNIEDMLEKKVWCRTVPKKIEKLSNEVNILRSDCKLIASFNRNMEDDDFSTYWRVQELPQITMRRLDSRMAGFDNERETHKQNLTGDLKQLKTNLANFANEVASLGDLWDTEQTASIASDTRRIRKELTMYGDRAQLLNKREKLFGKPVTHFSEIEELSNRLAPYELFWLNAAEFFKYRERVMSEELTIESKELREKILEFRKNLEKSLEYFTEEATPAIHESVVFVIEEIDDFFQSKWLASNAGS